MPEGSRPGSALNRSRRGSKQHLHETAKTKKESDGTAQTEQRYASARVRIEEPARTKSSAGNSSKVVQSSKTGKGACSESDDSDDDDCLIKPEDLIFQPDSV